MGEFIYNIINLFQQKVYLFLCEERITFKFCTSRALCSVHTYFLQFLDCYLGLISSTYTKRLTLSDKEALSVTIIKYGTFGPNNKAKLIFEKVRGTVSSFKQLFDSSKTLRSKLREAFTYFYQDSVHACYLIKAYHCYIIG